MAVPSTHLSATPWTPTRLVRVDESFDTSMGTTKVKTDATFGFIKTMGNRQGPHMLASELVATGLAKWFRLEIAEFSILRISPDECFDLPRGAKVKPGPALVVQRAVRAVVVVVLAPRGGLALGGPESLEQFAVEELIAELRVEALDVPVLPGATGPPARLRRVSRRSRSTPVGARSTSRRDVGTVPGTQLPVRPLPTSAGRLVSPRTTSKGSTSMSRFTTSPRPTRSPQPT